MMTLGASKPVRSSQVLPHKNLEATVKKHLQHSYLRPPSPHSIEVFERLAPLFRDDDRRPLLLDSGCGTGDSSIFLGKQYPRCRIIGIDQSAVRLHKALDKPRTENVTFHRIDQFDFWRLARASHVLFDHHYLFYPNPWPKKEHLKRRIHGHPAFADLLQISKSITLRSNWRLYLEEFAAAFELATGRRGALQQLEVKTPLTLFEKKFLASGHTLYEFYV